MIVPVALGVVLVALFAWAIGYDLYWRRRGFRTEVRGHGRHMTHVRVPIENSDDDRP